LTVAGLRPAVAAAEIFGDAFHYGCVDPATGAMERDSLNVVVEDEFGCGDRRCPAEYTECKVCWLVGAQGVG
jgi:hypothetical protein